MGMERVTKKSIRDRIDRLQKSGVDIKIDSAYGQYRFVDSRLAYLSLRLPPGQLSVWLDGFETGQRMIDGRRGSNRVATV